MKVKLFFSVLLLVFVVQVSWAQIPKTISYQGNLADAGGTPVNGNRDLTFKIYESETGGIAIWTETQSSVSIKNGKINVIMGVVNPLDITFYKQYWLGISVDGGTELTPRCKLASVPYSFHSLFADSSYNPGPPGPQGPQGDIGPEGPGIALPYSASTSSSSDAFSVTQTGTGKAGYFEISNPGSPAPALYAKSAGGIAGKFDGIVNATQFVGDGASPLVLEGATADDYETTIAVSDPTADRTLTLPDAEGTVLVSGTAAIADLSDGSTGGGPTNLFIGTSAGAAIQSNGVGNTGLGYQVLKATTTGGYNTASGTMALYYNTTGHYNAASGYQALAHNTTGNYNTASGYRALLENHTADGNTAVGGRSLFIANRTADTDGYNTAFGYKAGDVITTGQYNVIIGADSDPSARNAVNQIVIGYNATGTGDNEIVLGNSQINAIRAHHVNSITTYSDRRIKRDIHDGNLGLAFINGLRTVKFKRVNPADYPGPLLEERFRTGQDERPQDDETVYDGLISQEVKSALDNLGLKWSGWTEDENTGKQGIQYGALVVPLIKAVQELSAKVEELERKLNNLEKTNADLSASE